MSEMRLADVTPVVPFRGPAGITKWVCYAASVMGGNTRRGDIQKIGENIGKITKSSPQIRVVESVLFGTGHGRLGDIPAATALAAGFRKTAAAASTLIIHLHGAERHAAVQRAVEHPFTDRLRKSIMLSPNWHGVGFNLKDWF